MKRPEYVASAVHELKSALEGNAPDMKLLRGVFSRSGFTDGYFTGKRLDMFGVREKDDVTSAHELIPKIHELYRFERKAYTIDLHAVIKEGHIGNLDFVFACLQEGFQVDFVVVHRVPVGAAFQAAFPYCDGLAEGTGFHRL